MKKWLSLSIVALFLASCGPKVQLTSGSDNSLRRVREMNVVFDYENVMVGAMTEEAYIEKHMAEKESEKRGSGEEWREEWYNNRTTHFQPNFLETFNSKCRIRASEGNEEADYTLHVIVNRIEPGWNIGISRRPAEVDFKFVITDKDGDQVVAYQLLRAPGAAAHGYDFSSHDRIRESFRYGGNRLGKKLAELRK